MRKTTITYKQPSAAMPVTPPVEKHEVKEDATTINHSALALWIGGFAGMGAAAISVLALVFWPAARSEWPLTIVAPLAIWLLVSAYYGYNWLRIAAVRIWQVDDWERAHRLKLEQAAQAQKEEDEPTCNPAEIKMVGFKILNYHYQAGLDCTRPECEAKGIDQRDWNAVNTVLKLLKIKGERKWLEKDFKKAADSWDGVIVYDDGTAMVNIAPNVWERVEIIEEES